MEKIEINFLGTGSAKPTKKRSHPAILLSYTGNNILFDCGEGTQRQFKIAGLNLCKLTHIFISHWHGDHTFGIPGVLNTLAMDEYSKKLLIYGPKGTREKLNFLEKIYGRLRVNHESKDVSSGKVLEGKDFEIHATKTFHGLPGNAYSFIIKDKLRLDKKKIGKLNLPNSPEIKKLQEGKDITIDNKKIKAKDVTFIEKGRKVTIIMDTSYDESLVKFAKNSDILICESTFSDSGEQIAEEYKHMTSTHAAKIAKKSKSKKLYLIHLSSRHELESKLILEEAKKTFKNTEVPKDFDKITI